MKKFTMFFLLYPLFSFTAEFPAILCITELNNILEDGDWLFLDIDETIFTCDNEKTELIYDKTVELISQFKNHNIKIFALTARVYDKFYTEQQLSKEYIYFDNLIPPYRFIDALDPFFNIGKNEHNFIFYNGDPSSGFRNGILFSGGKYNKGESLLFFINHTQEHLNLLPPRIVFLDDMEDNLKDVKVIKEDLEEKNIELLLLQKR